ncbi:uncharacterized protein [Palaemon carinicauda]|uniref:uncharacterized protein n=1 Tax=Palaemon carinicauda TaxID=392227 RepID=UPI0035B6278C
MGLYKNHNNLCSALFSVIAKIERESNNGNVGIGVHGIIETLAPLVNGASGVTAQYINSPKLLNAINQRPPADSKVKVAVGIYARGENLGISSSDNYITTSLSESSKAIRRINKNFFDKTHMNNVMDPTIGNDVKLYISGVTKLDDIWKEQFEDYGSGEFFINPNKRIMVSVIGGDYSELPTSIMLRDDGADIYQMHLDGCDYLVVVIPNKIASFDELIELNEKIDWGSLHHTFNENLSTKLILPTFKVKYNSMNLDKAFSFAGPGATWNLSRLFDDDRDISNILKNKDFKCQNILLTTSYEITVNVRGVSSSSVSALYCYDSINNKIITEINRPFLYGILTKDGMVVDMGIIMNPE